MLVTIICSCVLATPEPPSSTPAPPATSTPPSTTGAEDKETFKLDLSAPPALVISTDRPGFSSGTSIVPPGHFQLENGVTYTTNTTGDARTNQVTGPQIVARLGVLEDRLELRAAWSGYSWTRSRDGGDVSHAEGWNDISFGAKLKLWDQDAWIPRVALLGQVSIGAGEEEVSTQVAEPLLAALMSYDFGSGWSLISNVNVAYPGGSDGRFTQGQASMALWFPIVDRVSGFVETYTLFPNAKDSDAAWYTDFGATWLIDDRIQIDASLGFGLNREANDFFVSAGISFLF